MLLQPPTRLSQSLLWKLQRNFYNRWGIDAWRMGIVPHYVSSNPFVANAYARLALGFLRDWQAALDPRQPVHFIELGAGSGRLAYHFVKKFQRLHERSALKDVRWKYLLTDLSEKNLDFWRRHPRWASYLEAGLVDFALFDAEQPGDLCLAGSGEVLSPRQGLANPVVLIANYFFDSIPADCFTVRDGRLYESLAALSSPRDHEDDLDDPGLLSRVKIDFEQRPARADYYADPDLDAVLAAHRGLADTTFLFPNQGLRCLRHFAELARGRLLLIVGDKGHSREADLEGKGDPHVQRHGSISVMVNYHALKAHVLRQGGRAWRTARRHTHLNVSAFALGSPAAEYIETALAYDEAIEQGGPDEYYSLKKGLEGRTTGMPLDGLLAWLRFGGWDARAFGDCVEALLEKASTASADLQAELRRAVEQIWEMYYPIGEDTDLAFNLGMVLFATDAYREARGYFERSLQDYGPAPGTAYNLGLCCYHLGQFAAALEYAEQAIVLDPELEAAHTLRTKIVARGG
jgi:hypothetical protein